MTGLTPYHVDEAIRFGRMIVTAYERFKSDEGGQKLEWPDDWVRLADVYGVSKDGLLHERELFGLIAREKSNPGHYAVVFRGTDSVMDWLVDFEFGLVPFRDLSDAGLVENGFLLLFDSLTVKTVDSQEEVGLANYLESLEQEACFSVTGHSLGGAVACLQALELASKEREVELYTFASPRVGDERFASGFNARLLRHYRLVNKPDLVPAVPLTALGYASLGGEILLDSGSQPVKRSIECFHSMRTYLYLLGDAEYGLGACAL